MQANAFTPVAPTNLTHHRTRRTPPHTHHHNALGPPLPLPALRPRAFPPTRAPPALPAAGRRRLCPTSPCPRRAPVRALQPGLCSRINGLAIKAVVLCMLNLITSSCV
jgi:hypothetical protein